MGIATNLNGFRRRSRGACLCLVAALMTWGMGSADAHSSDSSDFDAAFADGVISASERESHLAAAEETLRIQDKGTLRWIRAAHLLGDASASEAGIEDVLGDDSLHRDARLEAALLHARTVFTAHWRQPERAGRGFERLERAVLELGVPAGNDRATAWPVQELDWNLDYQRGRAAIAVYHSLSEAERKTFGDVLAAYVIESVEAARASWPDSLAGDGRFTHAQRSDDELHRVRRTALEEFRRQLRFTYGVAEGMQAGGFTDTAELVADAATESLIAGATSFPTGGDATLSQALASVAAYGVERAVEHLSAERASEFAARALEGSPYDKTLAGPLELVGLRWNRDGEAEAAHRLWSAMLDAYDHADADVDPDARALAIVQRAQSSIRLGQLAEAEADLAEARELARLWPNLRANNLLLDRMFERAEASYERAVLARDQISAALPEMFDKSGNARRFATASESIDARQTEATMTAIAVGSSAPESSEGRQQSLIAIGAAVALGLVLVGAWRFRP